MVDKRLKASKWRNRVGRLRTCSLSDNSPTLRLGENSVERPPVSQSVTTKQLGKALRKVQEVVIQGVCEKMKELEC